MTPGQAIAALDGPAFLLFDRVQLILTSRSKSSVTD